MSGLTNDRSTFCPAFVIAALPVWKVIGRPATASLICLLKRAARPSPTIASLSVAVRRTPCRRPAAARAPPRRSAPARARRVSFVVETTSTGPKPAPLRGSARIDVGEPGRRVGRRHHLQPAEDVVLAEALAGRGLDLRLLVASRTGPSSVRFPAATWARRTGGGRRGSRRRRRLRAVAVRHDREHDQDDQGRRAARENALGVHRGDATAP